MVAPEFLLRKDDKAGFVDLSKLGAPESDEDRIIGVELRTVKGFWYILRTLESTGLVDGSVEPLSLRVGEPAKISGSGLEAVRHAGRAAMRWMIETRHFSASEPVSLLATIIQEGDPLVINGHATSPIDVAYVYEPREPAFLASGVLGEEYDPKNVVANF